MAIKWFEEAKLDNVEKKRLSRVIEILGEEPTHVILSQQMTADGPQNKSLFLITSSFLTEVRLETTNDSFDISSRNLIQNYRIEVGEVALVSGTVIDEDGAEQAVTKKIMHANIALRHTEKLVSALDYFGPNCNAWIDFVLDAYPLTSMRIK